MSNYKEMMNKLFSQVVKRQTPLLKIGQILQIRTFSTLGKHSMLLDNPYTGEVIEEVKFLSKEEQ